VIHSVISKHCKTQMVSFLQSTVTNHSTSQANTSSVKYGLLQRGNIIVFKIRLVKFTTLKCLLLEVSFKLLFQSNCWFENIFSPYFCHEITTEFSLGELPTIQLRLHILTPVTMEITSFWDVKPIKYRAGKPF